MKINTILFAIIASSVFWGASADEGALRGFVRTLGFMTAEDKTEGKRTRKGKSTTLKFEMENDDVSTTDVNFMEFGDELRECCGLDRASVTFMETETADSGRSLARCTRRRARNGKCTRTTRTKKTYVMTETCDLCPSSRRLAKLTAKKVNACMEDYRGSDDGKENPARVMKVKRITID